MLAVPVCGGLVGVPGAHQHLLFEMTPHQLERYWGASIRKSARQGDSGAPSHIERTGETHQGVQHLGILAAASAQAMGAPEVAVEARHPHQHEARERIGATTPTGDYDLVIETGGSESALHRAVELARHRGTVVVLGAYNNDTTWPAHAAFMREVALRWSLGFCAHNGRREFAEAADMLASRPELPQMLITHRFPIEDAPEAFRTAADKSKGVFRVVVEP